MSTFSIHHNNITVNVVNISIYIYIFFLGGGGGGGGGGDTGTAISSPQVKGKNILLFCRKFQFIEIPEFHRTFI